MSTATITEPLPEGVSSDALFEVVRGVLVEKPTSALATMTATRLAIRFGTFVEQHRLGHIVSEMLFILDPDRNLRRRPDVAFVTAAQWPLDRPLPYDEDWELAPALAIEVISPGNTFRNLLDKIDEYFESGVSEVWLISPEKRRIYVHRSSLNVRILSAEDTISTDLIPGWSMSVADIVPPIVPPAPEAANP